MADLPAAAKAPIKRVLKTILTCFEDGKLPPKLGQNDGATVKLTMDSETPLSLTSKCLGIPVATIIAAAGDETWFGKCGTTGYTEAAGGGLQLALQQQVAAGVIYQLKLEVDEAMPEAATKEGTTADAPTAGKLKSPPEGAVESAAPPSVREVPKKTAAKGRKSNDGAGGEKMKVESAPADEETGGSTKKVAAKVAAKGAKKAPAKVAAKGAKKVAVKKAPAGKTGGRTSAPAKGEKTAPAQRKAEKKLAPINKTARVKGKGGALKEKQQTQAKRASKSGDAKKQGKKRASQPDSTKQRKNKVARKVSMGGDESSASSSEEEPFFTDDESESSVEVSRKKKRSVKSGTVHASDGEDSYHLSDGD